MAGLLNLVPRYLPRYGMAPGLGARDAAAGAGHHRDRLRGHGASSSADVDAQGGAYATGVLVLMTLGRRRRDHRVAPAARSRSIPITVIFVYTTIVNIIERPEGIKIAAWFILAIVVSSLVSRVMRSTELRAGRHRLRRDRARRSSATRPWRSCVRILAIRPNTGRRHDTRASWSRPNDRIIFPKRIPCSFSRCVRPTRRTSPTCCTCPAPWSAASRAAVLSPAIPNAIAGLLLDLRDRTEYAFRTSISDGPKAIRLPTC